MVRDLVRPWATVLSVRSWGDHRRKACVAARDRIAAAAWKVVGLSRCMPAPSAGSLLLVEGCAVPIAGGELLPEAAPPGTDAELLLQAYCCNAPAAADVAVPHAPGRTVQGPADGARRGVSGSRLQSTYCASKHNVPAAKRSSDRCRRPMMR